MIKETGKAGIPGVALQVGFYEIPVLTKSIHFIQLVDRSWWLVYGNQLRFSSDYGTDQAVEHFCYFDGLIIKHVKISRLNQLRSLNISSKVMVS